MESEVVEEVTGEELPNLNTVQLAKVLAGTFKTILTELGVDSKILVLHETSKPVDSDAVIRAIRQHTAALAYVVPKYGLTEQYIKQRIAEQQEVEEAVNEQAD